MATSLPVNHPELEMKTTLRSKFAGCHYYYAMQALFVDSVWASIVSENREATVGCDHTT